MHRFHYGSERRQAVCAMSRCSHVVTLALLAAGAMTQAWYGSILLWDERNEPALQDPEVAGGPRIIAVGGRSVRTRDEAGPTPAWCRVPVRLEHEE